MSGIFANKRNQLFSLKKLRNEKIDGGITEEENSLVVCPSCKHEYTKDFIKKRLRVCPDCGFHMTVSARERIKQLADKGTFKEHNVSMSTEDPLKFPGYKNKIKDIQNTNGNKDAVITGVCNIGGHKTVISVMDSTFMMGSMGTVVGEKFTQAVEYAMSNKLPFVSVACSGGARMQEGMHSLMQMAKTSAVIERFSKSGGFYMSILTHPTMGGVSASFATIGDIVIAEPKALIGFAGPRVIKQTINETLPKGFQRAEFQEEHGFVDMIVERKDLKKTVCRLLEYHEQNED